MEKYSNCPSCGALGKIDTECPFCGTMIVLQNSMRQFDGITNIRRSVSEEEFITRISKYKSVGLFHSSGVAIVSIGDLHGVININGDIIVPLMYGDIIIEGDRWCFLKERDEYNLYDFQTGLFVEGFKATNDNFQVKVNNGIGEQVIINTYELYKKSLVKDESFVLNIPENRVAWKCKGELSAYSSVSLYKVKSYDFGSGIFRIDGDFLAQDAELLFDDKTDEVKGVRIGSEEYDFKYDSYIDINEITEHLVSFIKEKAEEYKRFEETKKEEAEKLALKKINDEKQARELAKVARERRLEREKTKLEEDRRKATKYFIVFILCLSLLCYLFLMLIFG